MTTDRGFPEIGKRLLSIRGALDQRGFSRHVNVSQQAISNYERGNLPASWSFLRRLIEDFNVNLNWLVLGEGHREYRGGGGPAVALKDNRHPGWPRFFLRQVAFSESEHLDLVLEVYFLYLATEPADAKTRLMSDLQAIIEASRVSAQDEMTHAAERESVLRVYDALARDDRRGAATALIAAGEVLEAKERRRALPRARKLYLAALGLARFNGWLEPELEASRRVARSYRKEGRWDDAERWFELTLAKADGARTGDAENGASGETIDGPPLAAIVARVMLGYGHVSRYQGDLTRTRERFTGALEWALRTQDPRVRAEVYVDLACLAFRERDWQKALDYAATGRAFAEQTGDARLVNEFKLAEGLVLRERGDGEAAEAIFRVLLAHAERERDVRMFALASLNLAEVLVDAGRLNEAETLLRMSAARSAEHGDPRNLALRELLLARIEAAKGAEEAARSRIHECLRFARDQRLTAEFDQAADAVEALARAASPPASRAG